MEHLHKMQNCIINSKISHQFEKLPPLPRWVCVCVCDSLVIWIYEYSQRYLKCRAHGKKSRKIYDVLWLQSFTVLKRKMKLWSRGALSMWKTIYGIDFMFEQMLVFVLSVMCCYTFNSIWTIYQPHEGVNWHPIAF